MPLLTHFETPARLRDLPDNAPFYSDWSQYISTQFPALTVGDNGGALYNPSLTEVEMVGQKTLTWMGFPRETLLDPDLRYDKEAAFARADSEVETRFWQNEYFEWFVHRSGDKIQKLTFVTETGSYYERLFQVDPQRVLCLYRELVSPEVQLDDIAPEGSYNAFNRWNTTHGIVHYIQQNNTLEAAIGLAHSSVKSATPFRDNYEASPSSAGGRTSVDPRVAYDVHMLVRKGLYVTLQDPIGLYVVGWNDAGFAQPDGSPAGNYWRVVRGAEGMVLRLEYEVPPELGFLVGDMTIGGRPINFGGQLAEHITVGLSGAAGFPVAGRRRI